MEINISLREESSDSGRFFFPSGSFDEVLRFLSWRGAEVLSYEDLVRERINSGRSALVSKLHGYVSGAILYIPSKVSGVIAFEETTAVLLTHSLLLDPSMATNAIKDNRENYKYAFVDPSLAEKCLKIARSGDRNFFEIPLEYLDRANISQGGFLIPSNQLHKDELFLHLLNNNSRLSKEYGTFLTNEGIDKIKISLDSCGIVRKDEPYDSCGIEREDKPYICQISTHGLGKRPSKADFRSRGNQHSYEWLNCHSKCLGDDSVVFGIKRSPVNSLSRILSP